MFLCVKVMNPSARTKTYHFVLYNDEQIKMLTLCFCIFTMVVWNIRFGETKAIDMKSHEIIREKMGSRAS